MDAVADGDDETRNECAGVEMESVVAINSSINDAAAAAAVDEGDAVVVVVAAARATAGDDNVVASLLLLLLDLLDAAITDPATIAGVRGILLCFFSRERERVCVFQRREYYC
jgi:hypothetical protein